MAEQLPLPFGVKFQEAIAFLKGKLPEATMAWDDLAGPVHSKVFAVAGAAKVDLLSDLHKSLISAVEHGTTITQFRKDFDATVQRNGWTYNGTRGWRTRVIFDNNMRSAHMAGRWQQIQTNKDRYPYLQYRTAGDSHVRPQHRLWAGLIYPVDSPFWVTHYPPNGWGCRCTVRAYAQRDIADKNLQVQPTFDPAKMKTRDVVTVDGDIKDRVPVGIDPGWDHNVGRSWITPELALGEKLARLPLELRGPIADKAMPPAFQTVLNDRFKAVRTASEAAGKPSGQAHIVGFMDSATIDAVAQALPELGLDSTAMMLMDDATGPLQANAKLAARDAWPENWVSMLPAHLRSYQAVLLDLKTNELVVVPQGKLNSVLPSIRVRLNQSTNQGNAATISGLGRATRANLTDTANFKVLLGGL